jgi:hypothetical protein
MHFPTSIPHSAPIESPVVPPCNREVAELLDRVAEHLVAQGASLALARTWSRAATIVRELEAQVRDLLHDEEPGAREAIQDLEPRVLAAIDEIVRTRGLAMLARLEGDLGPEAIATRSRGLGAQVSAEPPMALLLEVDARYRALAADRQLPCVAPRRFNPSHEAWLPMLHVEAEGFRLHAMFANTARAHELGRTNDWVVIVSERDGVEAQVTIVTEERGPRAGERVVRGVEDDVPRHASHVGA